MQDQHNNSLIDPMGECTQCLLNLVVIGRATPYLHNGEMQVEQEETGEVRSKSLLREPIQLHTYLTTYIE